MIKSIEQLTLRSIMCRSAEQQQKERTNVVPDKKKILYTKVKEE